MGEGEVVEKEVNTSVEDFQGVELSTESGMYQYLKDYLPENDTTDKKDESQDVLVERLAEEQRTKFNEIIKNESLTEDSFKEFSLTAEELETVKTKFPDKFTKKNDLGLKLEEMESSALIDEVKKNQRLVSDRDTKIKELEEKLKVPASTVTDEKFKSFIDDLRKDIPSAIKKYAKDFDLPDMKIAASVTAKGSIEDRLLNYQENELKAQIEKEFSLEKGEFAVVREDLYTPKTPSYRWRVLTEAKEKELGTEIEKENKTYADNLLNAQKQQANDMTWFAKEYYDNDMEKAKLAVQELNEIPLKISKGELTPEAHPFSLRNLLLGMKHKEILAKAIEENTRNIMEQLKSKGVLIKGDEFPIDITKIKSPAAKDNNGSFKKSELDASPMLRNLNELIS